MIPPAGRPEVAGGAPGLPLALAGQQPVGPRGGPAAEPERLKRQSQGPGLPGDFMRFCSGRPDGLDFRAHRRPEVNHREHRAGLRRQQVEVQRHLQDGGLSFFSGHTATAFALATVIHDEYPLAGLGAYGLAALTGWSRMHDRMHWASDVVTGGIAGWGGARVAMWLDDRRFGSLSLGPAPVGSGFMVTARW